MNDAQLQGFRILADAMSAGDGPQTWHWFGPNSQRMFGITERRARAYAETYGGVAATALSHCHDSSGTLNSHATVRPDLFLKGDER